MSNFDDDDRVTIYPPGAPLPTEAGRQGREFTSVDTSWRVRRRGRALARTIQGLTGGLKITAEHTDAETALEKSRQELERVRGETALLPLQLERQRHELHRHLLTEQLRIEEMLAQHHRSTELAQADHELALAARKEEKLAAKLRRKRLKLDLERLSERHEPPAEDDTPPEFRRHWKTEQRARANRSEAEQRIMAIYERARVERRGLSADEIEEVDALADAAEAAEADVRRRAAGL